jgi:hypothetical protein
VNYPDWLAAELDRLGEQNAARHITRAEAVTAVRDAILRHADRAFMAGVAESFAARALDSWHRQHRGERAPAAAQSELFPGLPARLYVRPGVAKAIVLFDGRDWDNARAMILNRTKGAIEAAEADQAHFQAAYDRIRPLLTGDLTTADVVAELDGAFIPEATGT